MNNKYLPFNIILLVSILLLNSNAQDTTYVGLPEDAIARLGKGGINIMRFSPDGSHLTVGTDIGLWLYNVSNGEETALYPDQIGHIHAIDFSPDGKMIASGGSGNPAIQLWDIEKRTLLSELSFTKRRDSVNTIAFSEDGNTLIHLHNSGLITHWDVESNERLYDTEHIAPYTAAAFSSHRDNIVTGNRDGKIRFWHTKDVKKQVNEKRDLNLDEVFKNRLNDFKENVDREIWSVAFSPDGTTVATGSFDNSVRIWNTEDSKIKTTLKGHNEWILSVAFSRNGDVLASGDAEGIIKLWDITTEQELNTLKGHTSGICALTYSPDGKSLASGSYDGTIRFWNYNTGKLISNFTTDHKKWITQLAFTDEDTILTSASYNGTIDVWNLVTNRILTSYSRGKNHLSSVVKLSPDTVYIPMDSSTGSIFAFNPYNDGFRGSGKGGYGNIEIWNMQADELLSGPWQDMYNSGYTFAFSSDYNILAVLDKQQGIRAWNINTGQEAFLFPLNTYYSGRMQFSPDSKLLTLSSRSEERTYIWDVTSLQEITPPEMKETKALAISRDSKLIAAGYNDRIVLWDLTPNGMKKQSTIIDIKISQILEISPDKQILLTTKSNNMDMEHQIQLWDANNGTDLGTLMGHTEEITTLTFSINGKTLASGSRDGTILLWDWNKVVSNVKTNGMVNTGTDNSVLSPETTKYTSKVEEAKAVKMWLDTNSYDITKTGNSYTIKHPEGYGIISGQDGGTISIGNVTVRIHPDEILNIHVDGVGSATFKFDQTGNLYYFELNSNK